MGITTTCSIKMEVEVPLILKKSRHRFLNMHGIAPNTRHTEVLRLFQKFHSTFTRRKVTCYAFMKKISTASIFTTASIYNLTQALPSSNATFPSFTVAANVL
mmetsp:Transcript_15963/g.28762  ORF Transcript_15963/g.28762 Transcript_15963/m.28762 type:complete len:102 (+) Transcript_15963:35-340(+)